MANWDMRIETITRRRHLVVLTFLLSCTGSTPPPSALDPEANVSGPDSCLAFGELACAGAPFVDLATGACPHLKACLEGRRFEIGEIVDASGCEAPARLGTSLSALASISVHLDTDGPPSHASYLLFETPRGWCAVAELLTPAWTHGGYCEAAIQLASSENQGRPSTVRIDAERICHMPLDQEEFANGESDLAFRECWRARFSTGETIQPRVRRLSVEETCSDE